MTLNLEANGEQNGEPHSWGFHPFTELIGLSIGLAAVFLPICCVLGDRVLPKPAKEVIIGVATPQPLRIAAPETR
jgi:hypothetical protein